MGVSPLGTTINLFDYWLTEQQTDSDDVNPPNFENRGINQGHALLFGKGMGNDGQPDYGDWNHWTRNKNPKTGIVDSRLDEKGYPVLNLPDLIYGTDTINGRNGKESLAYLFDPDRSHKGKAVYKDVQNLLQIDKEGYYYYDSQRNYAVFYEDTNSFLLYDRPGVEAGGWSPDGQFFPFNAVVAESLEDGLFNSHMKSDHRSINHYFGIHMSTRFVQQNGGYTDDDDTKKTPITYEFSGDDDVWVFIDGELVADLGGIHDMASLSIDFATGVITINGESQKQTLGEILGYRDKTLPDDTYHTLDFFYLERGNVDSNMSLKYNLVYVPESSIYKIDQDGNPLPGRNFELYEALPQDGKYVAGDLLAEGTTDAGGRIILLDDNGDLLTIQKLFDELNPEGLTNETTALILRETDSPDDGYRSSGDLELYFYQPKSQPDSPPFLLSKNHWQTGAYAVARLTATTDEEIEYGNGHSTTFDPENHLMFAVVFKKVGKEWLPISGSPATGWTVAKNNSWESIQKANLYPFMLSSSGSYTAMIDELPGDVKKYVEAVGVEEEGSYRIRYYFSEQNVLEAIKEENTFEIKSPMNRVAAVNLYVPNIRNDLTVQKLDQNGDLITDGSAIFELRPALDGTYNPSVDDVKTRTEITSEGVATFTAIPNGTYYLVETAAPKGYTANATQVKVIVNDTGVYANAGTEEDGISVERGVGRLVNSMAQFASKNTVDTTLNQIVAKFYTTQTKPNEDFQWRKIEDTDDGPAFSPVEGVVYHPAYSVTGTSPQDTEWYLFETGPDGATPVGMHLAHSADHQGDFCDGLYQTTVTLASREEGITAQETDTGWSALLVEQCMFHTRDNGTPHTNLTGKNLTDLTALFTGDVTVKVKNDRIVGNLAVQKTVAGNAGDTGREWNFTVTLGDTSISDIYGDMSFTGGKATFTLKHGEQKTARGLPAGISYTVTEAEASQDGYTTQATGASGQIPAEGTATAAFTNTKNVYGGLTVTKTVAGNAGDTGREWNFTVTLGDTSISDIYGDMSFTGGKATFTLKHGEQKTARGLPAGIDYFVSEAEASQDGYTTRATGASGQIPAEGTATAAFTNMKSIPRGNLSVSKTVSGSNPPSKTAFGFTVILSDRTVDGRFGEMTFRSGVAEFTLRHGETVTATGLPAGVGYLVEEDADEAYTTSSQGAEGTVPQDDTALARFVNRRIVLPPKTGDDSHTELWFMLMAFSLCCAAFLIGHQKRGGRTGR